MKNFLLIFILIGCNCFSQNNFVVKYNYKSERDSIKNIDTKEDVMNLILSNDQKIYVSENNLNRDLDKQKIKLSAEDMVKSGKIDLANINVTKSAFTYYIVDNFSDLSNQYYLKVVSDNFKFNLPKITIEWTLENETKYVNQIKLKKASTKLFNKEWIAWYSEDYEINKGPYLFDGLPGLIFELYDTNNYYSWNLTEIKTIDLIKPVSEVITKTYVNTNDIKLEDLNKILKFYHFDRVGFNESKGRYLDENTKRLKEEEEKRKQRVFLDNRIYYFF